MSSVTRLVVGVADYLVGEGLVRALEAGRKVSVVSICSNLDALLAATEEDAPDAVVTELRLAPTFSDEGLRLAAELRHTHPGLGVVVLGDDVNSSARSTRSRTAARSSTPPQSRGCATCPDSGRPMGRRN
jgi:DNA-binding NarL/FixJ family response regulator